MRSSIAIALFCLLTPLTRAEDAPKPAARGTWSQIQKKTYDFKSGDVAVPLEYELFVPSTYDKAKKTPLVVALHGLYSNPQQMIRYPGLTELAEKYGYRGEEKPQ
jgi:poly(3-hydroxybutyrate) depolymerase